MTEIFSWQWLWALLLGGLYGALFGAIPGLTATLAVALFLPIAFFLDPAVALPAIIAISSVAIFAGDVGSTIARIPGTPASAAYLEEIFLLSRKKGPFYSLGLSGIGSSVGGIIGTLLLIFTATAIATIAKQFSSFEYFWIAVLGLMAGVFASGGPVLKSIISLLIGLWFSTVGVDPTLGYPRFDFGNPQLLGGLNYVVAMIGLFGFSEILERLYSSIGMVVAGTRKSENPAREFYWKPLSLIFRNKWLVIRSSLIGVLVGFLPGAGADIGAWVSSSIQKMRSLGKKEEEDKVVLSGSSSNNASVASAWIPALALGLPGDTITAIVLGVFLMKGISPGPLLFEQEPGLIWSLYLTFIIANLILLPVFGFIAARMAAWLIKVPVPILLTVISGVCIVGAYTINHSAFDVWVMAAMGMVAFMLRRGGFPLAQVVLGMVLGPILEQHFMVSAIKSKWDLGSFFDRPMAIVLLLLTLLVVVGGLRIRSKFFKGKDIGIE